MRGGTCRLDEGHRGRHATVVFYCDGCGRYRRSRPVAQLRNHYDGTVEAQFCFMCAVVDVNQAQERAGL
jgi:hypothetical protein